MASMKRIETSWLGRLARLVTLDPKHVWVHYRTGHAYRVTGLGRDTKSGDVLVTYQQLVDIPDTFVRPLGEFLGDVKQDGSKGWEYIPRFSLWETR